jgi:zinc transport system permease protein
MIHEVMSYPFFVNALLMSVLLGLLFGLLSFFIIVRKMAFLGAGIAHIAFGGVALGLLAGINPMLSALVFCVTAAVLIGRLIRTGYLNYDTGIGILFSFSMALGVLIISARKDYTFDLTGYLFGNILGVTRFDLILTGLIAAVFIPFILLFLQKLLYISFDEPAARVSGVPVDLLDTFLLISLAVIIVASIRMVGIILVSALTVLPASFGILISKQYFWVIVGSLLFGLLTLIGGLFLAYQIDLPAGATIVALATVVYLGSLGLVQFKKQT